MKHIDALKNFDSLPEDARVRQPVVEALFGFSSATLWRRVKAGSIPQPLKDYGCTSWRVGDLRQSLAGK